MNNHLVRKSKYLRLVVRSASVWKSKRVEERVLLGNSSGLAKIAVEVLLRWTRAFGAIGGNTRS